MDMKEQRSEAELLEDRQAQSMIRQRFLQWVTDQANGNIRRANWRNVTKKIEDYTGITIGEDTLRQKFLSVSKKKGIGPRPIKKLEHWQALYRLLTSDAVAYLRPDELPGSVFRFSSFSGLQAFVEPQTRACFPTTLLGRFSNINLERTPNQMAIEVDFLGTTSIGPSAACLRTYRDDEFELDESFGGLSFEGGAVHRGDGFVMVVAHEVFSDELLVLLLLQTHPALDQSTNVSDIAISLFSGLLSSPLLCELTPDRDESLADPDKKVMHNFEGALDVLFLTRC